MDMQGLALLLELFDFDGDLVRQLGAHLAHDFLAHQFGGEETAAAVGDLVFREEVLVLRQVAGDHALQGFEVVPVLGRDRHDLGIRQLFLQPAQVRHQLGLSSMRSVLFSATINGPVTYCTRSRTIWSSSVHLVRSTTKITTSTSFNAAEAVLFM